MADTENTSLPDKSFGDVFVASEKRIDHWCQLHRIASAWEKAKQDDGLREKAADLLSLLAPLEDLCGYPGPHLMAELNERFGKGDRSGFLRLAQSLSAALLSGSYRENRAAWTFEGEDDSQLADYLSHSLAPGVQRKPYFEFLVVTPDDRASWPRERELWRKQRHEDNFVEEPVLVGNLEDAVLATIVNYNLQAVVIEDGFGLQSISQSSDLRALLSQYVDLSQADLTDDIGVYLAHLIKEIRPELDVYLITDRDVFDLAASEESSPIRRIFYGIEEPMEVHLSIMEGVAERYATPYFDNLKHHAERPIGTFHALPIARGKSVFKSNWIRDMGEFYGTNLFLAESSATTGGLDSLLEPTGNIKLVQDAVARAFGGDHAFLVTNGTSTSNKIVHQAILVPGDIALIDRNCHKSHHYAAVLAGAQPLYLDAFPLAQYSMYGSVPIRTIKQTLLQLKAEGKLDRVKLIVLTNCTFDGHMANTKRTMLECLAIKPDLVFLWDEAWFGFARFSPLLRRRTGMEAARTISEMMHSQEYRRKYEAFKAEVGEIDPSDDRLLDMQLLPDPDKVRVRAYETDSVHKSMSSLRQGSIIVVRDQEFHRVEPAFKEAFFTHTSTSPNLQIIASIDVARRQMELEGYELVSRAAGLAVELRQKVNNHPLISKYFQIATPAEMIPGEFRGTGYEDYHVALKDTVRAIEEDEFFLEPTRVTLLCGHAGLDGSELKELFADKYNIQINKTSRNSVLIQININNTRSDMAHLLQVLMDMSRNIEKRLAEGGDAERTTFEARVKALVEDVPDLPNFSTFHDAFRDNPASVTKEGHMREAYYMAYDQENLEYVPLRGEEIEHRLQDGPPLVSAKFVIPYPPGFPIMVPGQVITRETVTFMRKLDVKEIHGFNADRGLELLKPDALAKRGKNGHE